MYLLNKILPSHCATIGLGTENTRVSTAFYSQWAFSLDICCITVNLDDPSIAKLA